MKRIVKSNFQEDNLAYFFIGLYFILSIIWHFSTNAPWDDDCVNRFFNTKGALSDPLQFINRWNRPLFVILFVLPFQLGKHMILLMAVFSASGAYALYRSASLLKMKRAFLVVPLLLFQAFYFTTSRSSLAEPLIAVILSYGLYFYLKKKWFWFAIIGSLIPLARQEITPFLLLWAFYLLKERQWKYVLMLGLPTLLWNFGGYLLEGDPLWLLTETLGTDTGTNRYGHKTFGHYFQRYIYVTGPFVFYFFLIGLLENFYRKRWHPYIDGQFILGFFIYVIFSWKLNLGQAAGFLRHLITLAPLASLICLQGINYWYGAISTEEPLEKTSEEESVPIEQRKEIQEKIELLEKQLASGEIKRKDARHQIKKKKEGLLQLNEQLPLKDSSSSKRGSIHKDSVRILLYSFIIVVLTFFFFSNRLAIHHNLLEDQKNYQNLVFISILALLYTYFFLFKGKKRFNKSSAQFTSLLLIVPMIGFTLITEPPDVHNSPERAAMTKLTDLYKNSYLKNYPIYSNHTWIAWEGGYDRSRLKQLTTENLETAPDSSIIIWDTHYSNRLSGNVFENYLTTRENYVELIRMWTDSMNFKVVVYQKVPLNRTSEDIIRMGQRLVASTTDYKADAMLSLARNEWYILNERDKGFRDCQKAVELDPNNFMILIEMGNFLMEKNEYETAQKYFDKSIELTPNYYYAYLRLGTLFLRQKKLKKALKSLDRSIELKESSSNFIERGNVYFNMNQLGKALGDYREAIRLGPNESLPYFNAGVVLLRMSKTKEACQYFNEALRLNSPLAQRVIDEYCK